MKLVLETVTYIVMKERVTCIITIKSHMHNALQQYHPHNFKRDPISIITVKIVTHIFAAETVTCIYAAEIFNCIIATETVTCIIVTERSTSIAVTESTTSKSA